MRVPKSKFPLFVFAMIIFVAMTAMFFGSAPHVQAQDISTPTPEIETQIVGGVPAEPGEWAWQVALVGDTAVDDFYNGPGWQFCGGSLIHPRWVLTAAHCITEGNGDVSIPSTIDIVAGIYDLESPAPGYQRRNVIQIIRHPDYNDGTLNNDIALIKLDSPVIIGGIGETKTSVLPLVPSSIGDLSGEDSWVTGWGDTLSGYPTELREVQLPIISNAVCNNSSHWGGNITSTMLCAGFDSGSKSSCNGDSGGPLVVFTGGQWKLAGIVSFGPLGCAKPKLQSVLTRVSAYVNWVNANADIISPTVMNSVRANANPTNITSVNFTITFSENVTGVNASDFAVTTTGVSGATLNGISGSGSNYTVIVNTGSGNGTIRLDIVDNDSIMDASSNPLGETGTLNGSFNTGETYNIDKIEPSILSITRANANPTTVSKINFLITLSESVTGLDVNDFVLATTGVAGASIANVSGSGVTHTVSVNTGSGDGAIRLDVIDNGTILDAASNSLANGYTSGEFYTIDKPDLRAPTLRSPRTNIVTNNTLLTLWWTNIQGGQSYEIQFATDNAFSTVVDSEIVTELSYTVITPFLEDQYYWRVRAYNASNQPGVWSLPRAFTIDTTGPSAPILSSPANNTIPKRTPTFKWLRVSTAILYEFQYDNDSNFLTPTYTVATRSTFRKPPAMKTGSYYWRVRAKDAVGNWGSWSAPFTITITGP